MQYNQFNGINPQIPNGYGQPPNYLPRQHQQQYRDQPEPRKDEAEELKKVIDQQNQMMKKLEIELANSKKEIETLNKEIAEKDLLIHTIEEEQRPKADLKTSKPIECLDSDTINNLEKVAELGNGASGTVFKVLKTSTIKETLVLKVMSQIDHENLQKFLNEYELLNMLDHPNVLKTFGIFMSNETLPPSILLEFCPKDLQKAIEKKMLSKVDIVLTIYQIAEGMKYVHFRGIIHRDLKPSNILIADDGTVKICDFGISKLMSTQEQQTTMTKGIGTLHYMAPEIANCQDYNEKVDVYSFGVLVFFILNGKIPALSINQMLTIPKTFTDLAKNLIDSCWNFDPNLRPSLDSICSEIEKNNFELIDLSLKEKQEIQTRIRQYKRTIPSYQNK